MLRGSPQAGQGKNNAALSPDRRRRGGVALIIVMISIFVLTMLAGGFALSMKVETQLARNANNETELEWLGRSGVEYCRWILAQQLTIAQEPYDAPSQVWAGGSGSSMTTNSPLMNVQKEIKLGHGSFTWKIVDLESKININTAGEPLLQQAFLLMGMDAGEVTATVNSILDWIDPDDRQRIQGAESEFYQSLKPAYFAKNGPIDDLSELLLVKGVTPDVYWGAASTNHPISTFQQKSSAFGREQGPTFTAGLADLFTPLSDGRININTASAEVLQCLPGLDKLVAEAIVSGRAGEDDGSGLLGPYRNVQQVTRIPEVPRALPAMLQQYCDVRSKTFQVTITATMNGYTREFNAVLGRANAQDVQVLNFYWK